MADRTPNAFYHYSSKIYSYTQGGITTVNWGLKPTADNNIGITDDGVFITSPASTTLYVVVRSRSRTTYVNSDRRLAGGINMNTTTNKNLCYKFGVLGNGSRNAELAIFLGNASMDHKTATYVCSTLTTNGLAYKDKLNLMVDKVEVCYKTSDSEVVYTTGICLYGTLNDQFIDGGGFIIARAVPISGDGFVAEESDGSSNGSILFHSNTGKVIGRFSGTNVASTSATIITQSLSTAVLASNDGLCAVSCMCMADGEARWLSHKNGIYKIYQGATPLKSIPGEKVTIKGHDFVGLTYGPFYARMS